MEYGNFITETYVFGRFRWRRLFQKSGWTIEKILSNRLYYSGYMVGQRFLSMNSRKNLSYLLGGSCNIFVLKKMINNKKEADDTKSLNELGKDSKEKFYVAKPSLPDIDDFIPYLEKMWATGVISNNGPFNQELEKKLAEYLEVPYLSLFSNGTLALITAIQASNLSGEVITSPFTFIATPNSLVWNNLNPVFVDVDPTFGNLDPAKIEEAINEETSAILPVHVYGNPCEIEEIDKVAKKYNLKVIYDAAHAFGVRHDNQSVLNFGDFSILSLHTTKVFNTFEGGVISKDFDTKNRIDRLRNFGIVDELQFQK